MGENKRNKEKLYIMSNILSYGRHPQYIYIYFKKIALFANQCLEVFKCQLPSNIQAAYKFKNNSLHVSHIHLHTLNEVRSAFI